MVHSRKVWRLFEGFRHKVIWCIAQGYIQWFIVLQFNYIWKRIKLISYFELYPWVISQDAKRPWLVLRPSTWSSYQAITWSSMCLMTKGHKISVNGMVCSSVLNRLTFCTFWLFVIILINIFVLKTWKFVLFDYLYSNR